MSNMHPVTLQKRKDSHGPYWYLTCRYCPWSARCGDKVLAHEEKRSHGESCWHYRKKLTK